MHRYVSLCVYRVGVIDIRSTHNLRSSILVHAQVHNYDDVCTYGGGGTDNVLYYVSWNVKCASSHTGSPEKE